MSEAKRVPLQTLEFPESLGYAAKKDKKGDKGKQFAPSFRFTLALPESNEKTCPEFNYAQLLKAAEKKRRKETKKGDENATNGLDPFDDEDEDKLVDMARRFEAKYGTATLGKKRRKYDDYVDLGAGYDENDSFIDNTDAYDEIVPEEVTTAHGGFYINSGALEFKTSESHTVVNNNNNNNNDKDESSESSEEDTEGADSPKRSEKRVLSSSDDEETEDVTRENPQKKQRLEDNTEKKSNHENIIKKKKKQDIRPHNSQQQDVDILNRRKEKNETDAEGGTGSEDQEEKKKIDKIDLQRSKNLPEKKFAKKSSPNGLDVKQVEPKKLDDKDNNIDDAIESVVNAARVDDESSRDTTDSGKSRGIVCTESEGEDIDKEEAPLPDSLPEDVKEIINTLKAHAETNKEGKNKFFNTVINTALFSLERKLSMLNQPSIRQQTYAHLSHFLPCSKVTLVNRVKKLCLQDVEYKVRESLQRLKTIIDTEMPAIMEKHMKECKKVADEKWYDGSPVDAESTEDEDSSNKNPDKSKIPRRRFPWTEETKRLVYDIANARRQYFKILRPRKESMESFVKTFMSTKVLPLWPPGYVRLETLLKYSNIEPVAKKKSKKLKEMVNTNSLTSSGPSVGNTAGTRVDTPSANNSSPQDQEKSLISSTKTSSGNDNFSSQGPAKLSDLSSDRKQQLVSKPKDKNRENSTFAHHQDTFPANVNNSTIGKISVVPTAQLMAQKPVKNHMEKFNLMDLANSSLSITPMNDYQKAPSKVSETKKDVISITAYTEHSNVHSNVNEVSSQQASSHVSGHRSDVSFGGAQLQHSNYPASNQQQSLSKPLCLKQRLLQDNVDGKSERRIDEKEFDVINKTDNKKEKKRERCGENKHRSQETKKRKKEQKIVEQQQQQQHVSPVASDLVPIPQQTPLSKEEQEQRQIEETVAATNFLSQIINDDASPRSAADKRKDSGLSIDEPMSNLMQQSDQEKDVQMVIKELQELQEMKYSSGHSPMSSSGIQKSGKSNTQYATYQDEYQRFYVKKEEKLRSKDEVQW